MPEQTPNLAPQTPEGHTAVLQDFLSRTMCLTEQQLVFAESPLLEDVREQYQEQARNEAEANVEAVATYIMGLISQGMELIFTGDEPEPLRVQGIGLDHETLHYAAMQLPNPLNQEDVIVLPLERADQLSLRWRYS